MPPRFFYHPRMLEYDFGPRHPLKPERLHRTVVLLEAIGAVEPEDPGLATERDALMVHTRQYVSTVEMLSSGLFTPDGFRRDSGIGTLDTPAFVGMYEASLAYLGGSIRAAEAVRDGERLAFNLAGGLHHAHADHASGFCVFNDAAAAIHVLLERFERVAYVDIDVHHGDGVQSIWLEDPRVLTVSIHEDPSTLFPGTGSVEECGPAGTAVNVPIPAKSAGPAWLEGFERGCIAALRLFEPQAIVLQMGTDPHFEDPLGHLRVAAQEWIQAVASVRGLGVPIVALGGGGYNLSTVPRMWAAACLTLMGRPVPEAWPSSIPASWDLPPFEDPTLPEPRAEGLSEVRHTISVLEAVVLPRVAAAAQV
ncbi:MAG: hypothetical protein N2109_00865 [Fimbriimonadales bacterium]|nr:hypothetical protein [Fimbriimonadales bacterium]